MLSASFFNANAIEAFMTFGAPIGLRVSDRPIGAPNVIDVSIELALNKLALSSLMIDTYQGLDSVITMVPQ